MLIILLLVSMTESAYGHPADKGDFSLREINDWFHLLGAEAWGGGLLALSVLVLPQIIKTADTPGAGAGVTGMAPALIVGIARRFSMMSGYGLAVMAVTAVINYLTYVSSATALLGTPYGITFAVKIVLFLIIINLGAFNRYISVPALEQWAGYPARKPGIFGWVVRPLYLPLAGGRAGNQMAPFFKRAVRAEMFLVLALLFCAAVLSHEPPASHYMHMRHSGPVQTGGVHHEHSHH
jgi:putative copper resistance protein D